MEFCADVGGEFRKIFELPDTKRPPSAFVGKSFRAQTNGQRMEMEKIRTSASFTNSLTSRSV